MEKPGRAGDWSRNFGEARQSSASVLRYVNSSQFRFFRPSTYNISNDRGSTPSRNLHSQRSDSIMDFFLHQLPIQGDIMIILPKMMGSIPLSSSSCYLRTAIVRQMHG